MSNKLTIGEIPNKKTIESLDLTRKVTHLGLWCGKRYIYADPKEESRAGGYCAHIVLKVTEHGCVSLRLRSKNKPKYL